MKNCFKDWGQSKSIHEASIRQKTDVWFQLNFCYLIQGMKFNRGLLFQNHSCRNTYFKSTKMFGPYFVMVFLLSCNYQLNKGIVHGIKFGGIAVM